MADTISIAGKPVKKRAVGIAAVGTGIFGLLYYKYYKNQQASQQAAAAAAAAQTATGTGAGSSDQIDPATGFPYGSAEDEAALTSQAGYESPGGYGIYNTTGYPYESNYYPNGNTIPGTGMTTNAQWAQAAESYLVNTTGADPNTVGNALGKYITGQPVDPDAQQPIIEQAIAFEGYPPQSGPNGYPPAIQTAPASPPPTGGTIPVPNVVGDQAGEAHNTIMNAKLIPRDAQGAIPGESSWKVVGQSPQAGTMVNAQTDVTIYTSRP